MKVNVDLQLATLAPLIPTKKIITTWLETALDKIDLPFPKATLTIRIVDADESQSLNSMYRQKDSPTNVLAFPFEDDFVKLKYMLLGDLVICYPIVTKEADEQGKTFDAHFAHLILHGCLHLLGYDHIDDVEALEMEEKEIQLLELIGYTNPYDTNKKV